MKILQTFAFLLASFAAADEPGGWPSDNWKYLIGPFEFAQNMEISGIENPITGRIFGRINSEFDLLDVRIELDNEDDYPDYFPASALKMYHADGTEQGTVALSVRGKGDIVGCFHTETGAVCSETCQPENLSRDCSLCPDQFRECDIMYAKAEACPNGCNGDQRPGSEVEGQINHPSRYCDMKRKDKDGMDTTEEGVEEHTWISAKYCDESSGNMEDSDYSEWSIFKEGNFDWYCGIKLPHLKELFAEGSENYFALHFNHLATGHASLETGSLFATVNDGSGTKIHDYHGEEVMLDEAAKPSEGNTDWIYEFGPLELSDYPDLTGASCPIRGRYYAEVNRGWDMLRLKLEIDNKEGNEVYWPMFASHIHHGDILNGGIGGHVITTISGRGDIYGCFGLQVKNDEATVVVCSEKCLDEEFANDCEKNCPERTLTLTEALNEPGVAELLTSHGTGFSLGDRRRLSARSARNGHQDPQLPTEPTELPFQICGLNAGPAYGCAGGCLHDERPESENIFGSLGLAPSRYCDIIDPTRDSDMPLDTWVTTKMSMEMSGNEADNIKYSPYSINKRGNFQRFCGVKQHNLLQMLSAEGESSASYIAVHMDFNATGTASTNFGDVFAVFNDGNGVEVRSKETGMVVEVPKSSDARHQCCQVQDKCNDEALVACLERIDPHCANADWDYQCVHTAQKRCGMRCN